MRATPHEQPDRRAAKAPGVAPALVVLTAVLGVSPARAPQAPRDGHDAARPRQSVGGAAHPEVAAVEPYVRRGLAYLAQSQSAAGYWAGDVGFKVETDYYVTKADASHIGVSALALMAFLAAGELPGKGKYGRTVSRAIDYIVGSAAENGYLQGNGTRMYSHAFATLALGEVYGMANRIDVKRALQRSVNLISDSQNREGGWRYKPFAQESDMSITVCQVMALRAARNAGVYVSKKVIDKAVDYVRASASDPGRSMSGHWRFRGYRARAFYDGVFKYQKRADARATFALTAAGVTILYGAGIYDDPLVERGLNFMASRFEEYNNRNEGHYFFFYGNYYAVQAFYIAGGERWQRYFTNHMIDFLATRQNDDGSWDCHVGPGKNFATAVCTLILAIPYNYLPIFQR